MGMECLFVFSFCLKTTKQLFLATRLFFFFFFFLGGGGVSSKLCCHSSALLSCLYISVFVLDYCDVWLRSDCTHVRAF